MIATIIIKCFKFQTDELKIIVIIYICTKFVLCCHVEKNRKLRITF